MKYVLAAVAMMAMLTSPAYSQLSVNGGAQKTPLELQYEREAKEREQNEKDYNSTMKRLKTQDAVKTNSDPWKTVRPSTDSTAKR